MATYYYRENKILLEYFFFLVVKTMLYVGKAISVDSQEPSDKEYTIILFI